MSEFNTIPEFGARSAAEVLDHLGFPTDWDQAVRFMEDWRGRRITYEHRVGRRLCGVWFGYSSPTGDVDVVRVDLRSDDWRHNVAHEWGHMLCRHDHRPEAQNMERLVPDLPARALLFACGRVVEDGRPLEEDPFEVGPELLAAAINIRQIRWRDSSSTRFGTAM